MSRSAPSHGRLRRLVSSSRAQMALRAALAAGLSWALAEVLAGALGFLSGQYVYYAPLGAVVATSPTVAASLRTARSAVLALSLGAALGLFVHAVVTPGPLSLAVVVGVGVALGAVPGLGRQRSWVAIVALFVLAIGGDHAFRYALAYVALVALGAGCAVMVNLLLPSLRLGEGRRAIRRLERIVADRLRDLARTLRERRSSVGTAQEDGRPDPEAQADRVHEAVQDVMDARRDNPRARRHAQETAAQREVASALRRVAVLTEELPEVLGRLDRHGPGGALDAELAAAAEDALDRLADVVLGYDAGLMADDPRVVAAERSVERLTATFGRRRDLDADHLALLGALVANLRGSTDLVGPGLPQR